MAAPAGSVKRETGECGEREPGVSRHHRDLAVHRAARDGLWDRVEQLVDAGVSTEQRDFVLSRALRYGRWALMSRLLALGVSAESRSLVVREGLGHGQWEIVLAALGLGVTPDMVDTVFQDVVTQRQWQHVPALVRLFKRQELTQFVLQAAIRECQWGCVLQLTKIGLTADQQEWICHEALEWSHWECALELLRQGIAPHCGCRIVAECLGRNRRDDLVELLKEDGTEPSVRDTVLGTAAALENWDDYLTILEAIGPTEKELVVAVTTALHTVNILLIVRLLSRFTSTRRVFKQVLLRTQFDYSNVIILNTILLDGDPDLVFHMFVAQELWECVVGMYDDVRLHTRARRFALRHALTKQAWQWLEIMAGRAATRPRDRRHVFLQAARQGQWRVTLRLSAQSVTVSLGDKVFCLRTWLKLGHFEIVQDVLVEWDHPAEEKILLKCILEECIIAGKLKTFRRICIQTDFDRTDQRFVFQVALTNNKYKFVLEFCRRCSENSVNVALELAMESKKWKLMKEIIEHMDDFVHPWHYDEDIIAAEAFHLCLRAIRHNQSARPTLGPVLDGFCQRLSSYSGMLLERSDATEDVTELTDWCLETSYGQLALLLAVMSGDEERVARVTDQLKDSICCEVFKECFLLAVENTKWGSAVTCLRCLSIADAEEAVTSTMLDFDMDLSDLIGKCRERELYSWATYLGVWTRDWENVNTDLVHCQSDTPVVDFAIEQASKEDEWDVVRAHLTRCSQDQDFLGYLLRCGVFRGQSDCCKTLMTRVDPLLAGSVTGTLLHDAVISFGDREEMVKLCIEAGLSTHVPPRTSQYWSLMYDPSPMETALRNGQLPLVKLLHKAGACSHEELFRLQHDPDLKTRLKGQGRQDILQYLDTAATTPRSLQDLCRLQISHLLGCRPGRPERVMSLGGPWPVRHLINFEDVLS